MQSKLILFFSLVFVSLGFSLPEGWLAMMAGEKGELLIPVSSGSEDPFIIKVALASFLVSLIYAGICIAISKGLRFIPVVYAINSIFYLLCMFLVSRDSSILDAAKLGNWVPAIQLTLWFLSVVAISWATFNKPMQPTGNASAD
jgi:hypothetical protein